MCRLANILFRSHIHPLSPRIARLFNLVSALPQCVAFHFRTVLYRRPHATMMVNRCKSPPYAIYDAITHLDLDLDLALHSSGGGGSVARGDQVVHGVAELVSHVRAVALLQGEANVGLVYE
jgi:hypothetical protein